MDRRKALVGVNLLLWAVQLLYTASPIDLVPDFLPLIGWIDDGLGLLVTIGFTLYTVSVVHRYGVRSAVASTDADDPLSPERIERAYARGRDPLDGYEPLTPEELEAL